MSMHDFAKRLYQKNTPFSNQTTFQTGSSFLGRPVRSMPPVDFFHGSVGFVPSARNVGGLLTTLMSVETPFERRMFKYAEMLKNFV